MRSTLCTASLALILFGGASAVSAAEGDAGADYVQDASPVSPAPATASSIRYEFDPVQRDAWLADCHGKVAASRPRSGTAREGQGNHGECEAYLADYLARYRQGQVIVPVYGQAAPGYAYVYPAQSQRMVSIPVVQAIDSTGEPIAYAEDAQVRPARRSIPRRAPAEAANVR
nr:hypothetical protein [Novosphingobium panipatense]